MNIDRFDLNDEEDPIVKGGQGRTSKELIDDTKVCAVLAALLIILITAIAVWGWLR